MSLINNEAGLAFFERADDNALVDFAKAKSTAGHLAIDVYKTDDGLAVRSTIAGARLEDLDIVIDNGVLTIRGRRIEPEAVDYRDYLYRECYWGEFSRSVILPMDINEDGIEADLSEGVLTITLPLR